MGNALPLGMLGTYEDDALLLDGTPDPALTELPDVPGFAVAYKAGRGALPDAGAGA